MGRSEKPDRGAVIYFRTTLQITGDKEDDADHRAYGEQPHIERIEWNEQSDDLDDDHSCPAPRLIYEQSFERKRHDKQEDCADWREERP